MSRFTDQGCLQTEQYKDASNLNARIWVHQRFSTNDYGWHPWVFDQLDLPARCRTLDVGCGPGDLWLENEDRIPRGWAVTLSDLSPGMLQKARQNLDHGQLRFTYRVFDAQAIPFLDESYDAVIANHMLFHVPNRDRALSEMHRVLKPGGLLYASTVGHSHLRELKELLANFCADADDMNQVREFALENGAEQIAHHFTRVRLKRYEDALVVTEAEPLIAYALSMIGAEGLQQDLEALTHSIREEIAAKSAFHIQKDSGMFIAMKV